MIRPLVTALCIVALLGIAARCCAEAITSAAGHFADGSEPGDHNTGALGAVSQKHNQDPTGSRYESSAGVVKTVLHATVTAHQSSDGSTAAGFANAQWHDFLKIDNPDLLIQFPDWAILTNVYFRPQAHGSLLNGDATFAYSLFHLDPDLEVNQSQSFGDDGFAMSRFDDHIPISMLLDGIALGMSITMTAQTSGPDEDAKADFGNTAYLPPLFIGDQNGNPIPELAGLRIVGESGASYAVTTVQRVPGDYNGNGIVDGGDYVVWHRSIGQTGTTLPADGDGNKIVDDYDYNVWRMNFGLTAGGGAGANTLATAPEPISGALLIFGALLMTVPRRRR